MFNAEKMRAYYSKIEKARKLFDEKSIDIICHFMDFYYEGKYDEEQRKKDEEFLSFSAKTMGTLFDILTKSTARSARKSISPTIFGKLLEASRKRHKTEKTLFT